MSNDVFILAEHLNGRVAEITFEMAGKARQLAAALGGKTVAVLLGSGLKALAESINADSVLYVVSRSIPKCSIIYLKQFSSRHRLCKR